MQNAQPKRNAQLTHAHESRAQSKTPAWKALHRFGSCGNEHYVAAAVAKDSLENSVENAANTDAERLAHFYWVASGYWLASFCCFLRGLSCIHYTVETLNLAQGNKSNEFNAHMLGQETFLLHCHP